jgi:anti-sigma regulatory factor (Ser/Thr protein kinase)
MSPDIKQDIALELKNDLSELEILTRVITEYCESSGLSSQILFALNLSLEEVVANVISYGYEDEHEHLIVVRINRTESRLEIEVEDDGRAFNPLEQEPPDTAAPIEERPIGGLGIHLVRHYMDELEYKRQDGKNLLLMKKNI